MSEQPELLPCPNPWCDGRPFINWNLFSKRVQCSCGVKGPLSETKVVHIPADYMVEVTQKAELEAITAWNTRAEPVKVKPLVWEGNIAQNGMGGRYVIDWYDAGDLCTQLTFHSFGVPSVQEYVAGDAFVPDLKEAANAHHAARIREALE